MLILEVTPHVCNKPIKIWELPEIGDGEAFTQLTQLPKFQVEQVKKGLKNG